MRARDLMTTSVVTLSPDTPVREVARVLAGRGISGAPVVDATGRLLGIVTEGDLIRRLAAPADRPRRWILDLLLPAAGQAARFARAHGRRACDVMTTDLATVDEDAPVERVANLLEQRRVRRVPVVRDGRLVGIVSRADLLRAVRAPADERPAGERPAAEATDDARIHRALLARMREHPWVDPYFTFADVGDGVVTLHGFCRSEEVKRALRVLAEGVPGVKEVRMDFAPTPPFLLARA
jgi:CBS domain-containing protein